MTKQKLAEETIRERNKEILALLDAIKLHNGKIIVKSKGRNKGSTFIIRLYINNFIEMNYSKNFLIYICRIIFFRKKAIILEKNEFLINHLTKLLNYLTGDYLNYDILFYSKEKYESVKKSYSE